MHKMFTQLCVLYLQTNLCRIRSGESFLRKSTRTHIILLKHTKTNQQQILPVKLPPPPPDTQTLSQTFFLPIFLSASLRQICQQEASCGDAKDDQRMPSAWTAITIISQTALTESPTTAEPAQGWVWPRTEGPSRAVACRCHHNINVK